MTSSTSIHAPADSTPKYPPVQTVAQSLPFGELTWENFERLCHRIVSQNEEIEETRRYGRSGQSQQGIDIFARRANGKYDVWQAKRYQKYTVKDLRAAISSFKKGSWVEKTDSMTIAVQASLADTKLQDEIELYVAEFRLQGISLSVLGSEELCDRLRNYPRIVLEFFGRNWTTAFFGSLVPNEILQCLDGGEVEKIRSQLAKVYQAHFHLLDQSAIENFETNPDSESNAERSLLSRFTKPDILVHETRGASTTNEPSEKKPTQRDAENQQQGKQAKSKIERIRRIPISSWLAQGNQLALIGDAGTGKSTVLRCIALDLIGNQTQFPEIASKWGSLLPIYVTFAKWTRISEKTGEQTGLKEVVRASLQPLLTTPDLVGLVDRAIDEKRIILLVDGLDEWSNEQAARTALQTMLTFVNAHQIPIVATGRPRGLNRIGAIPRAWLSGTLAPLSTNQQKLLVLRCLGERVAESFENQTLNPSLNHKAERFFRELKRESGLLALAEIPLLLVSLLALSLRRITLPRKRVQALDQLIDILLEIHPQSRATAAGDVQSRFTITQDIEVRKGAIAALAYASRVEGGDAGFPQTKAKEEIKRFLTDPHTHAFSIEKAVLAANEMLAVNAETVGLLIEKGPEEIGFVHASLEEYLAAVHIQTWDLAELFAFVKEHSATHRWRNVISNLIGITPRPTEIDQLVTAIASAETDTLGEIARRQLLTDIAFSPSKMSPATALRIGRDSIHAIEMPGPIHERSALLSAALNGVNSPVLGDLLSSHIRGWAPKTANYFSEIFNILASHEKSPEQLRFLQRGLFSQERRGQHSAAAAAALAKVYSGDPAVKEWLIKSINDTSDITTNAIIVRALILGWPEDSETRDLVLSSARSIDPLLKMTGIWGKISLEIPYHAHRSDLEILLEESNLLSYWDRPLALEVLKEGWPNDEYFIERCLQSVDRLRRPRKPLDRDTSINYLVSCTTEHLDIRQWIKNELIRRYPFSSMNNDYWQGIMRFAEADSEIEEFLIQAIINDEKSFFAHNLVHIFSQISDSRLKSYAIKRLKEGEASWLRGMYLNTLLSTWADDPDVLELVDEIRNWPDTKLANIVHALPRIFLDKSVCRARLLSIHRSQYRSFSHLYPTIFVEIGCDYTDQEVVDELLSIAERNIHWGGTQSLIKNFGQNRSVLDFARTRLNQPYPPFSAIATVYFNIPEFQERLDQLVSALPTSLRYILAEVASIELENNPTMADVIHCYNLEVDSDLKVLLSIRYHEFRNATIKECEKAVLIQKLLDDVVAVGPDMDDRRTAAVAGLITLGEMRQFKDLRENDEPLAISLGDFGENSGTLLDLISRNWNDLTRDIGDDLIRRLGSHRSDPASTMEMLAPYISLNPLLRREFLEFYENNPLTITPSTLKIFSKERANSDILEQMCVKSVQGEITEAGSNWDKEAIALEGAYILRNQFPQSITVKETIATEFSIKRDGKSATILAILDPTHQLLQSLKEPPILIGTKSNFWLGAVTISSATQSAAEFAEVVRGMINRPSYSIWDFQEYSNLAVLNRLAQDPELLDIFRGLLIDSPTNSEISSFSRFLSSVGALDENTIFVLRHHLNIFSKKGGVVEVGYDAMSDEIRPVSYALLDSLR